VSCLKLNVYQKLQATLLYHWMSLDYLKGLKDLIDALINGADVTLELAKRQGRDALIANDRWGVRDTSVNWSTYAFPALEDFRKSTVRDIALRATESYEFTGANQCAHMLGEFSSRWMSPEEEERFNQQFEAVCRYAYNIDSAAGAGGVRHLLNDKIMSLHWLEHSTTFLRLPKYRVRTDIEGVTGKLPPNTGVYVAQDDEFATLQFAWRGNSDGILGEAQTLNEAGHRAIVSIGRNAMWVDGKKMAAYAEKAFSRGELNDRGSYFVGDEKDPEWVGEILSHNFVTTRPCKWYFVERIEGEYDDEVEEPELTSASAERLRCPAGQPCPKAGYWLTPAKLSSRRLFKQGEVMPDFDSNYGATIWQWDEQE